MLGICRSRPASRSPYLSNRMRAPLLALFVVLAVGCTGPVNGLSSVEEPDAGGPAVTDETEELQGDSGTGDDADSLQDSESPQTSIEAAGDRAVQRCRADVAPPISELMEVLDRRTLEDDARQVRVDAALTDAHRAAQSCHRRLEVLVDGQSERPDHVAALERDTRRLVRVLDEASMTLPDDGDPGPVVARVRESLQGWERSLDRALRQGRG